MDLSFLGDFFGSLGSDIADGAKDIGSYLTKASPLSPNISNGNMWQTILSGGASIWNTFEQNKAANDYNQNLAASLAVNENQLTQRGLQIQKQANQQVSTAQAGALAETARADAISSEYGGGGNTGQRLAYAGAYTADANVGTIRTNEQNQLGQLNMQKYSLQYQEKAAQKPQESWLNTIFNIGGGIAKLFSQGPTLNPYPNGGGPSQISMGIPPPSGASDDLGD